MDTAIEIATRLVEAAQALRGDIEVSPTGEVAIIVEAEDDEHCHEFRAADPIVQEVGRLVGHNRSLEAEVDTLATRARRLESRLRAVGAVVDGADIGRGGTCTDDVFCRNVAGNVFAP